MPMVSVIMGVYNCENREEELKRSVMSIVEQTYSDWEMLICNDGSTDTTFDLLNNIAKIDDRIRILSYSENKGLSYALNCCIRHSAGKYIARQDDDDISYPERLEKQILFMENHKEYSIIGTIADVYDKGGIWGEYLLEAKPTKKSFLWNSPFLHPSVIMIKEKLIEVGGYRSSKETRRCEDYDLFMRMYANNNKGYNLQEKLYKYKIVNSNRKYRPMKDRIDEAIVRYKGYKKMKMLFPLGLIFVAKPIIIGMIPQFWFKKIKKKQYETKREINNI